MLNKTYILIFCILFIFQAACAQTTTETVPDKSTNNSVEQGDNELRARVKMQAEESNKAFLTGDYEKLFEMTHPKIQSLIGKEKFISAIKEEMKSAEADGFKLVALETAEPKEIVKIGEQMFAVAPQKMKLQTPQGLFVGESSEIAISEDGGKTWKFIGGGAKERLKRLFPSAADKLEIPEEKPPVQIQ